MERRLFLKGLVGVAVAATIPINIIGGETGTILETEMVDRRRGVLILNYDFKTKTRHYQYTSMVELTDKTRLIKKVRGNALTAFQKIIKTNNIKREDLLPITEVENNQKILNFKWG